jgi:hypothetical protein
MITGSRSEANELPDLYATPQFGLSASVRFGIRSPDWCDPIASAGELPGRIHPGVRFRVAGHAVNYREA